MKVLKKKRLIFEGLEHLERITRIKEKGTTSEMFYWQMILYDPIFHTHQLRGA